MIQKYSISPLAQTCLTPPSEWAGDCGATPDFGSLLHPEFFSWEELTSVFSVPVITLDKEKCPGFFPGISLKRRQVEDLESRSLLIIDIDEGTITKGQVESLYSQYDYFAHSTHSYTPEKPRWRVIFPLAEPISFSSLTRDEKTEKWKNLVLRFFEDTGYTPQDIKASTNAVFFFFYPAAKNAEEFVHWTNTAELLNLEKLPPLSSQKKTNTNQHTSFPIDEDLVKIKKVLDFVPASTLSYDQWVMVLMSIHSGTQGSNAGFLLVDEWSKQDPRYKNNDVSVRWKSFSLSGSIRLGSLFNLYKQRGGRMFDLYTPEELTDMAVDGEDFGVPAPQEEKKEKDFPDLEKLYAFLTRQKEPVSSFACREKLGGMADYTFSRLVSKDKEGEHLLQVTTINRIKHYTIRRPSVFLSSVITESMSSQLLERNVLLPADMTSLFDGGTGKLPREMIFGVFAYSDWGKSQFLLNAAIVNAMAGRKVLFLRHEANMDRLYWDLATRYVGRKKASTMTLGEKAATLPDEVRNIDFQLVTQTNLDDFVKAALERKPDIIVYDHLQQEYFNNVSPGQGSAPRVISNRMFNDLAMKGIPLITGAQQSLTPQGGYASLTSWQLTMYFCLEYTQAPVLLPNGNRLTTARVSKSKDGPVFGGAYVRWEDDPNTFHMIRAWDATEEIKNEREEARTKQNEQRRKGNKPSLHQKQLETVKTQLEREQKAAREARDAQ